MPRERSHVDKYLCTVCGHRHSNGWYCKHSIDAKDATIARLEYENAGLRARAEGLARECQAWRECDIARANDDSGIEPSGLSEASYSLSRIMAKTDAAGWLKPKEAP